MVSHSLHAPYVLVPFHSFSGERVNRGDDRISSTAMAVNALFYIWANAGGVLLPNTPEPVTYTLLMACHWLADNALSDKLEHMNVFFSGSVKLGSVVSKH